MSSFSQLPFYSLLTQLRYFEEGVAGVKLLNSCAVLHLFFVSYCVKEREMSLIDAQS